ncbi:hypothetical protein ACOSQ2_017764 [Xanthoceras sorbifolium]
MSMVSYQFLLNEETVGFLKPERGFRQGDMLSPYLFVVCTEGLSSLIRKAKLDGSLHGLHCGRDGPHISRLFFVDDSLQFFFKSNISECAIIKQILQVYEEASGQVVNFKKPAICFSGGVPFPNQTLMANILGVSLVNCHERYLGSSPSFVWRSLLWGWDLVILGSRWRIGNGYSTFVYRDHWVPRPSTFRLISPISLDPLLKVANLKTPSGGWNSNLVWTSFLSDDAALILNLPCSSSNHPDSLMWHAKWSSSYSVKSG